MYIDLDTNTKAGMAGGTILGFIGSLQGDDVIKTATLTIVGAVVSFTTSLLMKAIQTYFKEKFKAKKNDSKRIIYKA